MRRAEAEGLPYLFRLRTTRNVQRLLGWSRERRVVLLRRRLARELAIVEPEDGQLQLSFVDVTVGDKQEIYEYAVLVTTVAAEMRLGRLTETCGAAMVAPNVERRAEYHRSRRRRRRALLPFGF